MFEKLGRPDASRNERIDAQCDEPNDRSFQRKSVFRKASNSAVFDQIKAIADAYRPCDSKMREIIPKLMTGKSNRELLESLGKEMADLLTAMEKAVRPQNALLLREMATKLNAIVEDQDRAKAAQQEAAGASG